MRQLLQDLFFFSGEISPGYYLGIFITALESGINIRDDWYLCSLFCKQTKRVEEPFLAVLDFPEASMMFQSGEIESMFKLKKIPQKVSITSLLKNKTKQNQKKPTKTKKPSFLSFVSNPKLRHIIFKAHKCG